VGSKVSGNGPDAPVRNKIDRYSVSVEVKVNDGAVETVEQGQEQEVATPGTQATDGTNDDSLKIVACERQISDLTFGEMPGLRIVATQSFEEPPELVRRPETDHPEQPLGVGCGPQPNCGISIPLKRPETDHPEPKPGKDPRGHSDTGAPGESNFQRFVATVDSSSTMDPIGVNISQSSSYVEGETSEEELRPVPLPPRKKQNAFNHVEQTRRKMKNSPSSRVQHPESSLRSPSPSRESLPPPPPRQSPSRSGTTPPSAGQSRRKQHAELTAAAIKASQLPESLGPDRIGTTSTLAPGNTIEEQTTSLTTAAINASKLPDPRFIRTATDDPPPPQPVLSPCESPVVSEEKKSSDDEIPNNPQHELEKAIHLSSIRPPFAADRAESDVFSALPSDAGVLDGERNVANVSDVPSDAFLPKEKKRVDALSDVPSDVDPASKERYLKACRLLKSALIQKRHDLSSSDFSFFHNLLVADRDQRAPSEAEVAAVESAYEGLMQDQPAVDMRNALLRVKSQLEESVGGSASKGTTGGDAARSQDPVHILLREGGVPKSFGNSSPDPGVVTPPIMAGLRQYHAEHNRNDFPHFSLKFSSAQESNSLSQVLPMIEESKYTIIGVETTLGDVFGAFCSSPWKTNPEWFGSRNAFLWRLTKSRVREATEDCLEIYPHTGTDDLIQYCTEQTLAVGGSHGIGLMIDGDMMGGESNSCSSFGNPRLCGESTSSSEFDVATIEVWEFSQRV